MAKIYSPPEEFSRLPSLSFRNWEDYEKECKGWLNKLKIWCIFHGNGEEKGKIVKTPVADGYAQYMVLSIKPLILIHIPLYDGWDFRWAHRWTSKDVKEMIQREKILNALFKK